MPSEIWLLIAVFAAVVIVFSVFKRPMYEAMAIAFLMVLFISGKWQNAPKYMYSAASSSILYTIVCFLVFSAILDCTGVIQDCIEIILACIGKLPGGSGVVAIIASCFMGALSGSGPGNVAATGSITIPLMKRSGYPSAFAAGVCMAGSCLSPVIPPSSTIVASFACLAEIKGFEQYAFSDFWIAMYGVSIWFIVQRLVQFYIMYYAYGIQKYDVVNLPKPLEALKKGWKSLLLVFIIMIPFVVDSAFSEEMAVVLGDVAASNFSKSVLLFTPAVAAAYCLLISRDKSLCAPAHLADTIVKSLKNIAPMVLILFFSYSISYLLDDCGTMSMVTMFIQSANLPFFAVTLIILAAATLLGMFMAGTALIPMFGAACITIFAGFGCSPVLIAALLPVLFVSLGQMTPPFAVCMYGAMAIAQSDFKETSYQAILWSVVQLLLVFFMIMGIVPVLGV